MAFATRDIATLRTIRGHPQNNVPEILALDHLIRLDEIMIIHHPDYGTLKFTNEGIRETMRKRIRDSSGDKEIDSMGFGAQADLLKSTKEDVQFLDDCPFIRKETNVTGWMYGIKTGMLEEVC